MAEVEVGEIRSDQSPPTISARREGREHHPRRESMEVGSYARGNVVGEKGGLLVGEVVRYPACVPGLRPFEHGLPCASCFDGMVDCWSGKIEEAKCYEGVGGSSNAVFGLRPDERAHLGPGSRGMLVLDRCWIHLLMMALDAY